MVSDRDHCRSERANMNVKRKECYGNRRALLRSVASQNFEFELSFL